MIAPLRKRCFTASTPDWHEHFLSLLPAIRRRAYDAFRHLNPEARQEAVQEVIADCLVADVRLCELDKSDLAYATPLALYAIRHVRCGRRAGCKRSVRDVSSTRCQVVKGIRLERLDHYNDKEEVWLEVLVEDRRATPADVAASRIDFGVWLKRLTLQMRRMAKVLATGESTGQAARKFAVSPSRISQVRRELKRSWKSYQAGQPATEDEMEGVALAAG